MINKNINTKNHIMRYLAISILLLGSMYGFGQSTKGLQPLESKEINSNNTYAVVVGISDYQDPEISDLQFADDDALAFAEYLQSPIGGALDEDHLKVLINEKATMAQFAVALDWLYEVAQKDDQVIIYFSGHGDVERKSLTQPGFLLCWDAPSKVYLAGGALALPMFQDVISTLSIQNDAQVLVITDACRSGKLSGSNISGSKITGNNLAKQYANEIKILSCQPEEYSIEGEQWGGGRGAFSYHLMDGIQGLADHNNDQIVTLKEIGRYLEDYVTEEVAPQQQNPMVIGDKTNKISDVDPVVVAAIRQGKKSQMVAFASTDQRGIEDQVLAEADSNLVVMYHALKDRIKEKKFLLPESDCAEYYFSILSQEKQFKKLHSSMRRNYAAALQDDAQQLLNRLIKSDAEEHSKSRLDIYKDYKHYPDNLRRAASLLGEQHYMYPILMARSYWFEGYVNDLSTCGCLNVPNARKVLPYYRKAIEYQEEMPHAWVQLAAIYGEQLEMVDSAAYYSNLAIEAIPSWVLVYDWMANLYLNISGRAADDGTYLQKAKDWLDRGLAIDSNSIILLNDLGYWYSLNGEYENEQNIYDRILAIDSLSLTLEYKGGGLLEWGKYDEAEALFIKLLKKDESYAINLGPAFVYSNVGHKKRGRKWLQTLIDLDFKQEDLYGELGKKMMSWYPIKAWDLLDKQIEKGTNDSLILSYYKLKDVTTLFEEGKEADALAQYNSIIKENIEHTEFLKYAALHIKGYDPSLSLQTLQHVVDVGMDNYKVSYEMSYLYGHQRIHNAQKEREWIDKTITKKSVHIDANCAKGILYIRDNKLDEAKSQFEYVSNLRAFGPEKEAFGYILKLDQGANDSALRHLSNGIKIDKELFLEKVSFYLANLPDETKANSYFDLITTHYPNLPDIHLFRSIYWTYYKSNTEEGFKEIEKAIKKGISYEQLLAPELISLRRNKNLWNMKTQSIR